MVGRPFPCLPGIFASPLPDCLPGSVQLLGIAVHKGRWQSREKKPIASSECFNPDWQIPSAGAVTHAGLPHWRPLLAGHQRSSLCFQTGAEPGSSWSKGWFSGSGISWCTEGSETLPNLQGIGDKFDEFMLRVRRVSSCYFEQGTCLSRESCPTGAGKGPLSQWHNQQNSLFTSGFLGRADMQGFSVAVRKFFSKKGNFYFSWGHR